MIKNGLTCDEMMIDSANLSDLVISFQRENMKKLSDRDATGGILSDNF